MKDKPAKTEAENPAPESGGGAEPGDLADLTGQTLGDFHVLRRLGEGGMGQVYLAEQLSLKRRVALKLLRGELANNETSRKRFEVEAKAVAKLNHANIVQVYAVGEHAGQRYMVLEYVDGRNLREYLYRKGPLEVPLALSIMRQTAAALARAAEAGVIHRDIKPENILLTRKGEVKVADFGLSRVNAEGQPALNLTQSGTTMGTPLYMSPEQVQGRPLDIRTDIYSLGVSCYHMLAGQPPFEGENAYAVALQHVQNEPLPLETLRPDLPKELCSVVARMMAKKPEERYQTPREVLKDLKSVGEMLSGGGKPAALLAERKPSPAVAPTLALPGTRGRKVLVGAAAVLLAATFGTLAGVYFRSSPEDAQEEETLADEHPGAQAVLGDTKKREKSLGDLVELTANPKESARLNEGIDHRIRLGVTLLDQRELDPSALQRAERFFQEQARSPTAEYRFIGRLGEGIVLAFQDQAKQSVERFYDAFRDMEKTRKLPELGRHPDWLKLIAEALEHDQRNYQAMKQEFPKDMALRKDLIRRAPPGGLLKLLRDKPLLQGKNP